MAILVNGDDVILVMMGEGMMEVMRVTMVMSEDGEDGHDSLLVLLGQGTVLSRGVHLRMLLPEIAGGTQ